MMALLIEKRSPPLIKIKKNVPQECKTNVIAGNGNRVVVSHHFFFVVVVVVIGNT